MPWSVVERGGEYCVVKDSDGSTVACHATREKALAQQRALYANEPSVSASLELDTNALFEEFVVQDSPMRIEVGPPAPPPVRIEVESASADLLQALTASTNALAERLAQSEERQVKMVEIIETLASNAANDREVMLEAVRSLVAAIQPVAQEPPVVNMQAPEQTIEVQPAQVNVPAPIVNVAAPSGKRKVTIERDPLTGLISGASVEEVRDGG